MWSYLEIKAERISLTWHGTIFCDGTLLIGIFPLVDLLRSEINLNLAESRFENI